MATSAQLLEQIQGKTVKQLQANEAGFTASQQGAEAAAKLSTDAASLLKDTAAAQAAIIREDAIAKMTVEQAQRAAALAAGYDPATGTGPIFDRIQKINQKGSEVIDLTKKLREERSTSIFKDPIKWLQASFLSDTKNQVVAATQELQVESTVLGQLNQAVQQTARTAEATQQTVTAAKIVAATKVAATEAELRAIKAEQEGIAHRVAAITARATMENADLNALHTLRGAVMAEQNYKLSLEQEARLREQFNWAKEEKKIQEEIRHTEKSLEGYVTETINLGNAVLGRPQMTGLDAKAMVQLFKKGGSEELNKIYQIGMSQRLNPKNPIVGPDPATAYDNIVTLGGRVTETQKFVLETIKEVKETLPQTARDPKTGKVDPKALNKGVQEVVASHFTSIRAGSGNMFDVGDLRPYVDASPQLAMTPFAQEVLIPGIKAGQTFADPKVVISLGMDAVKAGKLNFPELVFGITNTYQRANAIRQAALGLTSFGIVPPEGGLAYRAKLGFGSTVNLTDSVEVSRYLSSQFSGLIYNQIRQNTGKAYPRVQGMEGLK